MISENNGYAGTSKGRMYRDQLITTGDLIAFKIELLDEIQKLLKQMSAEPAKKWLKSPEVRKMLGISPGTLQNLRINGTLPYTKVGGVIFYEYEDICRMLEENRTENSLQKR